MRKRLRLAITFFSIVCFCLGTSLVLAQKNGKGSGDGKGSGGAGYYAETITPVEITFRDGDTDRLGSDGASYVTGGDCGTAGDGSDCVIAHIFAGSGGNYGNILFSVVDSPSRGLFIDLTDCIDQCSSQPFDTTVNGFASIKVVATDAHANGVCGMLPGDEIFVRMIASYRDSKTTGPGYIHFEPGLKGGKNPCRGNMSDLVKVRMDEEGVWSVIGDPWIKSCATWPGSADPAGVVRMPFEFEVRALELACQ